MRCLLAGVIIFAVSAPALTSAEVLCLPKTGEGTLSIRQACKNNEVQIDPTAVGLGGSGAAMKDSANVFVGVLFDNIPNSTTLRQVGAAAVVFPASLAGLTETSTYLGHDGTDCSGPDFREPMPELA